MLYMPTIEIRESPVTRKARTAQPSLAGYSGESLVGLTSVITALGICREKLDAALECCGVQLMLGADTE